MTFTRNTPLGPDIIAETQPLILANMQRAFDAEEIDHESYNSASYGKHAALHILEKTPPTTVANEGGLYTAQGSVSTQTELFFRREGQAGAQVLTTSDFALTAMPMTACGLFSNASPPVRLSNPGLNIDGASCSKTATGDFTIAFITAMATTDYVVHLQPEGTTTQVNSRVHTKAVGSVRVQFYTEGGVSGTLTDPTRFSVTIFGGHIA